MPTYDRTHGTTSAPSEADSRLDRPLRLDWSALFGGTLIGWGVMLVLALVAMAVGLAVIDPFVARPAASNAGAAASVLTPYFVLCCLMFAAIGTLTLALRRAVGQP